MVKSTLTSLIGLLFVFCYASSFGANTKVMSAKPLLTVSTWNGPRAGAELHQINESSFITVADVNSIFGIHRVDMDTGNTELLLVTNPPNLWSFSPNFLSGDGLTLINILGDLYSTDGTVQGTRFIKSFGSRFVGGSAGILVPNISLDRSHYSGSHFYTNVMDSDDSSRQLWISDGTIQGTIKLADNLLDLRAIFTDNNNETYFFGAFDNGSGPTYSLWRITNLSDYEEVATFDNVSFTDFSTAIRTSKGVFFCNNAKLWRFANNTTLSEVGSNCDLLIDRNDGLATNSDTFYFRDGSQLWRSRGLAGDQVSVANVVALGGDEFSRFCATENQIYFTVAKNDKFRSSLYTVSDTHGLKKANVDSEVSIERCYSKGIIASYKASARVSLANYNFKDEAFTRVVRVSPTQRFSVFSSRSIPVFGDSIFMVSQSKIPGKVDIVQVSPQANFNPSILELLLE